MIGAKKHLYADYNVGKCFCQSGRKLFVKKSIGFHSIPTLGRIFNEKVLRKLFKECDIEFKELFTCNTYVYLWKKHPLAGKKEITLDDLQEYPCLTFEQGVNNSFYYAEEMMSTYEYKRVIKADDRATMLNLMVGLNGFTLCSGIISEDLNGDDYAAIPLKESEIMHIGYIKHKGTKLSKLGEIYIDALKNYENKVL